MAGSTRTFDTARGGGAAPPKTPVAGSATGKGTIVKPPSGLGGPSTSLLNDEFAVPHSPASAMLAANQVAAQQQPGNTRKSKATADMKVNAAARSADRMEDSHSVTTSNGEEDSPGDSPPALKEQDARKRTAPADYDEPRKHSRKKKRNSSGSMTPLPRPAQSFAGPSTTPHRQHAAKEALEKTPIRPAQAGAGSPQADAEDQYEDQDMLDGEDDADDESQMNKRAYQTGHLPRPDRFQSEEYPGSDGYYSNNGVPGFCPFHPASAAPTPRAGRSSSRLVTSYAPGPGSVDGEEEDAEYNELMRKYSKMTRAEHEAEGQKIMQRFSKLSEDFHKVMATKTENLKEAMSMLGNHQEIQKEFQEGLDKAKESVLSGLQGVTSASKRYSTGS